MTRLSDPQPHANRVLPTAQRSEDRGAQPSAPQAPAHAPASVAMGAQTKRAVASERA